MRALDIKNECAPAHSGIPGIRPGNKKTAPESGELSGAVLSREDMYNDRKLYSGVRSAFE